MPSETLEKIPDPVVGAAVLCMFAVVIFAYVIHAYLLARLFKKATIPPWKAWVPIYQYWPLLELGGQKGFWAFFLLIPVASMVGSIFIYLAMYCIGLKLGKKGSFVLLGIFVPILWVGWLGLDGSKWPTKKKTVSVNGGLKD